jgi:hypothetical protein
MQIQLFSSTLSTKRMHSKWCHDKCLPWFNKYFSYIKLKYLGLDINIDLWSDELLKTEVLLLLLLLSLVLLLQNNGNTKKFKNRFFFLYWVHWKNFSWKHWMCFFRSFTLCSACDSAVPETRSSYNEKDCLENSQDCCSTGDRTGELHIHLEDPVSIKTVRRELHKSSIHGRAAIAKPLITESNAQTCKRWCHDHRTWTSENRKRARDAFGWVVLHTVLYIRKSLRLENSQRSLNA